MKIAQSPLWLVNCLPILFTIFTGYIWFRRLSDKLANCLNAFNEQVLSMMLEISSIAISISCLHPVYTQLRVNIFLFFLFFALNMFFFLFGRLVSPAVRAAPRPTSRRSTTPQPQAAGQVLSRCGTMSLQVLAQPENQHRAR